VGRGDGDRKKGDKWFETTNLKASLGYLRMSSSWQETKHMQFIWKAMDESENYVYSSFPYRFWLL